MEKENPIPQALHVIVEALREHRDYYAGWQANIAMAFVNELESAGYRLPNVHKIANKAADNFLTQLMRA